MTGLFPGLDSGGELNKIDVGRKLTIGAWRGHAHRRCGQRHVTRRRRARQAGLWWPGVDRLFGGDGADAFVFNVGLGVANVDTVTDFVAGVDRIELGDDVFRAFDASVSSLIAEGAFVAAASLSAALTAEQRIAYDWFSGALNYDADGSRGNPTVIFAVLQGAPEITAADFRIVG